MHQLPRAAALPSASPLFLSKVCGCNRLSHARVHAQVGESLVKKCYAPLKDTVVKL